MRVAVVSHSLSRLGGGVPEVLYRVCDQLQQQHSCDITVVGLKDNFSDQDAERWGTVSAFPFPVQGPKSIGYCPEVTRFLSQQKPDIVHTHGIFKYTSKCVFDTYRQHNIPYVISPHGMLDQWAMRRSRIKKTIAKWWFESDHLSSAACFHALSDAEAESIRSLGLTQPIFVIPNGIDLPDSQRIVNDKQTRQILYLGRIHPKKGISELIQAWANVTSKKSNWQLLIAGWDDGGHEQKLKSGVKELGVDDTIHFLGPVFGQEKAALLQSVDAYILPSHSEGLPMTVLEAWANELPVIMTEFCNLPDGFEHDAALKTFPNPADIGNSLCALFEMSSSDTVQMGRNGRQLVAQKYTWDTIAAQYHQVYRHLLGDDSIELTPYKSRPYREQ